MSPATLLSCEPVSPGALGEGKEEERAGALGRSARFRDRQYLHLNQFFCEDLCGYFEFSELG